MDQFHERLIPQIDADTNAFNDYIEAIRLPQNNDGEKSIRAKAMQDGMKKAIEVPLETMRIASSIWNELIKAARVINIASKSDLEVGSRALELGIWGAYRNVLINLKDISDDDFIQKVQKEADDIYQFSKNSNDLILNILEKR